MPILAVRSFAFARLPHWLRWVLVLPLGVAAAAVIEATVIVMSIVTPQIPVLIVRLIGSFAMPYALVAAGGKVAPSHKVQASIALAMLAVLVDGALFLPQLVQSLLDGQAWWVLAEQLGTLILFIVGAIGGLLQTQEEHLKQESSSPPFSMDSYSTDTTRQSSSPTTSRIKNILLGLSGVSVFVAWMTLWAAADYGWADSVVQEESKIGWVLAATSDNYSDITHPWMLFKTPVTSLWFVDPKGSYAVQSNVFAVRELRVAWRSSSRPERETSQSVVDCRARKTAYVDEKQKVATSSLSQLKWGDFKPGMPGYQIQEFVCGK